MDCSRGSLDYYKGPLGLHEKVQKETPVLVDKIPRYCLHKNGQGGQTKVIFNVTSVHNRQQFTMLDKPKTFTFQFGIKLLFLFLHSLIQKINFMICFCKVRLFLNLIPIPAVFITKNISIGITWMIQLCSHTFLSQQRSFRFNLNFNRAASL